MLCDASFVVGEMGIASELLDVGSWWKIPWSSEILEYAKTSHIYLSLSKN